MAAPSAEPKPNEPTTPSDAAGAGGAVAHAQGLAGSAQDVTGSAQGATVAAPQASSSAEPPAVAPTPAGLPAVGIDDGLQPRDLRHPSAMVPRLGLLARWFAWIFFKPVQFPPRTVSEIKGVASEGGLVYVLSTISLLDYLYFNWAFVQHGLPLAQFANGVSTAWLQPWQRVLAGWLRPKAVRRDEEVLQGLLRRRQPVLIFLRRAFSLLDLLTARPQLAWLRALIEAQRQSAHPLLIVPQVLVWHRDPDRTRSSILDDFFGDPSAPGRLRKLVSFVLNHRRAQVRTAEPINLQQFLRDHRHVSDEVVLTEQLRVAIARAMAQEDRVIRGAPIKPPAQVRREILEDPDVQSDLVRLAQETGKSSDAVRREADANLSEIAAKYTMNMVAFLSFLLALLWAKIYDGIEVDEDGLERIRQAGRQSPLVVVPSHKSHIDYLVISYIFYTYGLIPPHIAAGANLSFFPLGWIFRRGGAFFLRRSFHGQPIYAAAFRHYVRKLLADGHWLEFFPEGGRSRTGKLLPPKFGLIKHVLEAVADGVRDDVQFVPANFGYERLIEEKAYRKELEGGEKKSESPVEVLKATRVLVHKYGSIRIQFGQPMSVRALLEEFGAMGRAGVRDAAAFDAAVKVCGYRILGGINQAAVLTPTALTAAVLLTKTRKGILKRDLLLRVGYLLDLAVRRGAVLSEPLVTALQVRRQQILEAERRDQLSHAEAGGTPDPFGLQAGRARAVGEAVADVIDKALQLFESSRWVLLRRFGDEDVYIVRAEGRMHLDYYKNNMLHLFVPEALLATAILAKLEDGPSMAPHDLQDMTKFLSRMLKFEFVYEPGVGFEQQYTQTLADFIAAGWLVQRGHGDLVVASQVRGALRMYAKLLQSFVESYALMADAVRVLGKGPVSEAAFFDSVQIEAQKAFDLGTVECYEAVSKVNLTNALQIFREQGFVTVTTDGSGKKRVKLLGLAAGPEPAARFAAFVAQLRRLQGPWLLDRQ